MAVRVAAVVVVVVPQYRDLHSERLTQRPHPPPSSGPRGGLTAASTWIIHDSILRESWIGFDINAIPLGIAINAMNSSHIPLLLRDVIRGRAVLDGQKLVFEPEP